MFLTFLLSIFRNLFGSDYTETHYSEDGKRVTLSPEMVIFFTKLTEFLQTSSEVAVFAKKDIEFR